MIKLPLEKISVSAVTAQYKYYVLFAEKYHNPAEIIDKFEHLMI